MRPLHAQIFTNDRQQLPQALSRDVSHTSAHVPEMQQAKRESAEKIYTWAEHERHWTPLNNALTPQEAAQFGWRAESEISVKHALDNAMPAGQEHTHSRDVPPEQAIRYGRGLGL